MKKKRCITLQRMSSICCGKQQDNSCNYSRIIVKPIEIEIKISLQNQTGYDLPLDEEHL